jgi:hypothetical protein
VQKVNPLGLPPEQFCTWVRVEVEWKDTRLVMIDTVNGYELCTRDKVGFLSHLQQLVGFLKSKGVSVIMVNEIAKVTGELTMAETGMSFIADNSVLIKAFEEGGTLRKAIGVTRRRLGPHDDRFYEYRVTPHGLHIGGPLTQLRGIPGGRGGSREEAGAVATRACGGAERWVKTVNARLSSSTWVGHATGSWSGACSTRRVLIPGQRPSRTSSGGCSSKGGLTWSWPTPRGAGARSMTC